MSSQGDDGQYCMTWSRQAMELMKFLVEPSGQLQMAGFAGQTILNSVEQASSLAFNRSRIWRGPER